MRATPIAVFALAALLPLTACDDTGGDGKPESAACSLDEVSVAAGPASVAPAAGDTGEVPVSLTNRSATCTLDGFPRVRLATAGDSDALRLSPAEGAKAQKLTLAKGDSASFTLTYVRGPADDGWNATTLRVALADDPGGSGGPGEQAFRWSYGPVARKDGGTLDATVSAYQRAGD